MLRLLILLVTLSATLAYAEEAQAPSLDFLEFMGEWETTDGQWQDPIEFSAIDETELQQDDGKPVSEEQRNDQ